MRKVAILLGSLALVGCHEAKVAQAEPMPSIFNNYGEPSPGYREAYYATSDAECHSYINLVDYSKAPLGCQRRLQRDRYTVELQKFCHLEILASEQAVAALDIPKTPMFNKRAKAEKLPPVQFQLGNGGNKHNDWNYYVTMRTYFTVGNDFGVSKCVTKFINDNGIGDPVPNAAFNMIVYGTGTAE